VFLLYRNEVSYKVKKTINTARTCGLIIFAISILLLEVFASPVNRLLYPSIFRFHLPIL